MCVFNDYKNNSYLGIFWVGLDLTENFLIKYRYNQVEIEFALFVCVLKVMYESVIFVKYGLGAQSI